MRANVIRRRVVEKRNNANSCRFDCGEDGCPCAQRIAMRWTAAAAIFCSAIALFVWTAPFLLQTLAP